MNYLDILLWASAIGLYLILFCFALSEVIFWFKKVNGYNEKIINIYRNLEATENELKQRIKAIKEKEFSFAFRLEKRLEKLEQFKKDSELSLPIIADRLEELEKRKKR